MFQNKTIQVKGPNICPGEGVGLLQPYQAAPDFYLPPALLMSRNWGEPNTAADPFLKGREE